MYLFPRLVYRPRHNNQGDVLKVLARLVFGALIAAASFAAQALNYSFNCISFNSADNCSAAASQFDLAVTDGGGGLVNFEFTNTGAQASSITDIYFDWSSTALALTPGVITSSAGVSFAWGATPTNLPGGNTIAFVSDLGADSNVPTQPSGVNPSEWLKIAFNGSYADLVAGLDSSNLRIGIHAQGFADGGSESMVVRVPEPKTVALMLVGLLLMHFAVRRRKAKAAAA